MSALKDWLTWHSIYSHIAAPLWLRVPEKARWRIVHWLNKSDRFCWADLVSDALTYPESDACDINVPRFMSDQKPACASTCFTWHSDHSGGHACSCYCGKFQFVATEGYGDRREANA